MFTAFHLCIEHIILPVTCEQMNSSALCTLSFWTSQLKSLLTAVTTSDDEKGISPFIPFHIHFFKNLSYMILDKSFLKPWLIWHWGHILTDVDFPSTRCIWRLLFTSPALPSSPFKQAALVFGRGAWPKCGKLCVFMKPVVKNYIQDTISRSFSAVYNILVSDF